MHNPLVPIKLGLALATLAMPAFSQDVYQTINLAGTVVADNKTGLSYEAGGCITGLSQAAVKMGKATAGQMLVELDDRAATLAVKSASARVNDLQAAAEESEFAITVANANVSRVKEEQDFVDREFERTRVLFQRGLVNETALENGGTPQARRNLYRRPDRGGTGTRHLSEVPRRYCTRNWPVGGASPSIGS